MKTVDRFTVSRFGCLNIENNCRCNDHPKEVQRNVPCINIILRSDCKMHSNQYNYLRKENAQNENRSVPRSSTNLIKSDLRALNISSLDLPSKRYNYTDFNTDNCFNISQTVGVQYETNLGASNMLRFDSPYKEYNHTAFDTENRFNMPRLVGVQKEAQCNRSDKELTFNNTSEIQYNNSSFSYHPVCTNKISNDNKISINATKSKLMFSKVNGTGTEQTTVLNRNTINALSIDDKIETKLDINKHNVVNSMDSYNQLFGRNFPITKLENNIKKINKENKVSAIMKTGLSNLETNKTEQDSAKVTKTDVKTVLDDLSLVETDLKLKSANISIDYEYKTTKDLLKPTNYKLSKNSIGVSSLTSYINKSLIENDKIENSICTNKIYHNFKSDYKDQNISLKESTNKITLGTKRLKNLPIKKNMYFCTDTSCTETNCSALNVERKNKRENLIIDSKSLNHITTNNVLEPTEYFHHREYDKECLTIIDTALDTLQNMLKGIKKLKDNDTFKRNTENCQYQDVKCKNINCNYTNSKGKVNISELNVLSSSGPVKLQCMKVLEEIKAHTKTLEEQLIIMNKNIRIKKEATKKIMPTSNMNLKSYDQTIYGTKQQRDMITQNPEKKNVYVQDTRLKFRKRNIYENKAIQKNTNSTERQESNDYKKHSFKIVSNINLKQLSNHNLLKYQNANYSEKTQNVQIQCVRSTSLHIINPLSFKSISTSIPKEIDVSSNKQNLHHTSCCVQTDLMTKEHLQTNQIKKTILNELINNSVEKKNKANINDQQESLNCKEKATIMLLLPKGVNTKYLKSKYKKSGCMNFRPKCIIKSCIMCDPRLTKYELSKRKMQIPVVFKQLKPIRYKTKEGICSNKNSYEHFMKKPANRKSDLVTTVCTQSSDLQITTATSFSCTSFNIRSNSENLTEQKMTRNEACILS